MSRTGRSRPSFFEDNSIGIGRTPLVKLNRIAGGAPAASPVIAQTLRKEPLTPGPHKIQGIGGGFIPRTLALAIVDRVEQVTTDEAIAWARRLAREEGILSGISSGAAAAVARRLAHQPEFEGRTIVALLPDSGERYLSTVLFEGLGS